MPRTLIYLALILFLGASGAWLADHPGDVRIDWQGWRIDTSLAFIAVSGAALMIVGMGVQGLWGWLRREMPFFGANRHLARQRRGFDALNKSVLALAAGDAKTARRLSDRARRLLPPQPVTHVLAAQAARLSGDEAAAQAEFSALLDDPSAAFIGLRGLLTGAMRDGRTDEALKLAEDAFRQEPKSPWAAHTLFSLQARADKSGQAGQAGQTSESGRWAAARETLTRAERLGAFSRDDANRHRAALLFAEAQAHDIAGRKDGAEKQLKQALKLRKGFPPAVALLARLQLAAGKKARAKVTIDRAWSANPHPQILSAYHDIDPVERATERYRRVVRLAKRNPDHIESRLALAAAAVAAEHQDEAREMLDVLLSQTPVLARAHSAEADYLQTRGASPDDIAGRRAQARDADDYRWSCSDCGWTHDHYQNHCSQCGAFDSQHWKLPSEDGASPVAGSLAVPIAGGFEELLAPPPGANIATAATAGHTENIVGEGADSDVFPPPPDVEPPGPKGE